MPLIIKSVLYTGITILFLLYFPLNNQFLAFASNFHDGLYQATFDIYNCGTFKIKDGKIISYKYGNCNNKYIEIDNSIKIINNKIIMDNSKFEITNNSRKSLIGIWHEDGESAVKMFRNINFYKVE